MLWEIYNMEWNYEVVCQMNKLPGDSPSVFLDIKELWTGALTTFGLPVCSAMKRESIHHDRGWKIQLALSTFHYQPHNLTTQQH